MVGTAAAVLLANDLVDLPGVLVGVEARGVAHPSHPCIELHDLGLCRVLADARLWHPFIVVAPEALEVHEKRPLIAAALG